MRLKKFLDARFWMSIAILLFFTAGCRMSKDLTYSPPPNGSSGEAGYFLPTFYWSKDKYDLDGAEKKSSQASSIHSKTAVKLQEFELEECRLFPNDTRAKCPLHGHIEAVDEFNGGVKIHFMPGMNLDAVTTHMKCHQVFAQTMNYQGMDECPLYLPRIVIQRSEDGKAIRLSSDRDEVGLEIQRRTRLEFRKPN